MSHYILFWLILSAWSFIASATLPENLRYIFLKENNFSIADVYYNDKDNIEHQLVITCKKKNSLIKQPTYDITTSVLKNNKSYNSKETNSDLTALITELSNIKTKKFNVSYKFENLKYCVLKSGLGKNIDDKRLTNIVCKLALEFKKKLED